jgi:hypothetical protein
MAFQPIPYIQCVQFRNSAICHYATPAEKLPRSKKQKFAEIHLEKTYKGEVSKLSQKNIARAINLLVQSSPWHWYLNPITNKKNRMRINFITLTFSCSQNISLKIGYSNSLKPFLRWMLEVKKIKNYVWKAEYQKRGQLHYHITTNTFIHHTEIRNKWNYIQKQNGYLQEYWEKNHHYDANSTDVHAVYKIEDIESYLIKYMMKPVSDVDENKSATLRNNFSSGKVWGCSDNLRGKKYFTIEYADDKIFNAIKNEVANGNLIKSEKIETCNFYKMKKKLTYDKLLHKSTINLIENYAKSEFKTTNEFLNNQNQKS